MTTITEFHPIIQSALLFFSGQSLQQIADFQGVTKQAIHKKIQEAIEYLKRFRTIELVPKTSLDAANEKIQQQAKLIEHLRRELIINAAQKGLLFEPSHFI